MRDRCTWAGAIRLAALSLGLLSAARPAQAADAKGAPAPEVQGPTSFRIDPTCNAWRGVRFPVLLWNGGDKPLPLNLRMGDLASDPGGQPGNVKVALAAADGAAALPRAIAPAGSEQVVVALEGVLGAGKWSAPLYSGPTQLTTLTFVVPDVPLRVKVDVADPNAPALTVTRGRGAVLVLKNEDSVGYDLDWEFTLGARPAVLGAEPPRLVAGDAPPAARKSRIQIAAGGAAALLITPDERWFLEPPRGAVQALEDGRPPRRRREARRGRARRRRRRPVRGGELGRPQVASARELGGRPWRRARAPRPRARARRRRARERREGSAPQDGRHPRDDRHLPHGLRLRPDQEPALAEVEAVRASSFSAAAAC